MKKTTSEPTTANLGFEAKLWAAADALRNNMDAAEYKHVVLGLIFLMYISDAFEARHAELEVQKAEDADPEDPGRVPRCQHFLSAEGGALVVPEDFLARFDSAENKSGDQFYRPSYVAIYGEESNYTTWRFAKMNLAIRRVDGRIAHVETFHDDRYPNLEADYVLANPPFNDSDWCGELLEDDERWVFGVPPAGNANFAWVQHFIHHLAPTGLAGFVLANGSMSSNQSGEGEIRKRLIQVDLVDCMVALPGQLFYARGVPKFMAIDVGIHA